MEKVTHGINEESFEELSFVNQARSLNGQTRTIERAILAHLRKGAYESKNVTEIRKTYIEQLQRIIGRL